MLKEIVVVEGKDDTAAIRRAVDAETIETGGSAVNRDVIERVRLAQERRGVIIFTDPDHAGERIRKIVAAHVPGCKHAFLDREEATFKGTIGVENATPEAIRKALADVKTEFRNDERGDANNGEEVDWSDMLAAGLIHRADAAHRRMQMGKILKIGYANGKQFHKRCVMFRITKTEFYDALRQIEENGR